jgi:hypothetical protein
MSGQIKKMIDTIVDQRSKGQPLLVNTTRAKLFLKGINPDDYTAGSEDDPAVVARVRQFAKEMGVNLN